MQLEIEKTITPVKSPNTSYKVDEKPLNMEEPLMILKSEKSAPKRYSDFAQMRTPNPELIQTQQPNPELAQGEQQKQTPQKKKKKKKRKRNKTPQSNPNFPKTPESGETNASKKQKLNDTASKIVKPDLDRNDCKQGYTITVIFPKGPLPAKEVLPVYEGCKEITLNQSRSVVLSYDSAEKVDERAEELKKISFKSGPLTVILRKSNVSLLKKAMFLPAAEYQEEARKFFNAKSIDFIEGRHGFSKIYHVLTFETEEEAEAAASKKFVVNDETLILRPYFEKSYETNVPKVERTKNGEEAKLGKKQEMQKPEQVKRKAEDSGDEDDDHEEKETGRDDVMKDISIFK